MAFVSHAPAVVQDAITGLSDVVHLPILEKLAKSAFPLLPDAELLQWCSEQPERGPRLILGSIPLFTHDGESVNVTDLVSTLIAQYGSDEHVLSAMSGNLESFNNVGSSAFMGLGTPPPRAFKPGSQS
jgi:hypothetical protein